MIRAFLAVVPPASAQQAVSSFLENLQSLHDTQLLRWSRSNPHHVTIEFLGDIDEPTCARVRSAIPEIAKGAAPFSIALAGLVAFPSWQKMRVLAVAVEDPGTALKELQGRIAAALRRAGLKADARPYRPHITLARVRKGTPTNLIASLSRVLEPRTQPCDASWEVTHINLVQSHLGSGAPRYEILDQFKLGGDA